MIATNNLTYQYPGAQKIIFPDLSCRSEGILLLLGSSGVGKTTLLHLLGGILDTQEGSVVIDGKELSGLSGVRKDQFRGQHIGIIFQQNHFVSSLNVLDNILLAQQLAGRKADKGKALEWLDRLHVVHKSGSPIYECSQGERQRVAIVRALINQPKVILADEPTSALDDHNCFEVLDLLEEQARASGSALVVVTHDTRLKDKIPHQITLS
jgi:putative ABC transport system ATP-binding protein